MAWNKKECKSFITQAAVVACQKKHRKNANMVYLFVLLYLRTRSTTFYCIASQT